MRVPTSADGWQANERGAALATETGGRGPSRARAVTPAEYDAAWAVPGQTGDAWSARPWVHPAERVDAGKAIRARVPRSSHAAFDAAPDRDPVAILGRQEESRLQHLLPLRHARMASSAFAYYRGTPAVMAFDLASTPRTNIIVQASGDAHCENFGLFASPERTLVFDANDFDETYPAPWEWDVKRLAPSIVIAGRENGFPAALTRSAVMRTVRSYREWMVRFATMSLVDVWYAKITDNDIRVALAAESPDKEGRQRLEGFLSGARRRDQLRASKKLTTLVEGRPVIVDQPPLIEHIEIPGGTPALERIFSDYRATMAENRRDFLERYRFADFALKVVGVGSVGTRCFAIVLVGRDEADTLILQGKQAEASVLAPYAPSRTYANEGERVVSGQRAMQATPDIMLGWSRSAVGRDFYFRQLWDMKGSVDTSSLRPQGLALFGALCGWSLARAHARTGDAVAIASYLGTGDTFDGAIADFAETYADVNERDHAAYLEAIQAGRISTTTIS